MTTRRTAMLRETSPEREEPPATERDAHRARVLAVLSGDAAGAIDAPPGRLAELTARFGLNPLETDVLAVLWVGALDPELRAQAASREAYAGQITARLIATLFGHAPRVRLASESPLLLWHLVQEHAMIDGGAALAPDAAILAWLEGENELDRALAGRVRMLPLPAFESLQWGVERVVRRVREGWQHGARWRLHLRGADAFAARACAAALGARFGLPVLDVPAGALNGEADAAVRLHRQAFLDGCMPMISQEDAALSQPTGVIPFAIQVLHGAGALSVEAHGAQTIEIDLDAPGADEREHLWRSLWPEAQAWPALELADLALCHEAEAGDIAAAAATAPESAQHAALALRERTRADLGTLVRRIDARFVWDDLVLPEPTHARLREIAFEARERVRVWSDPAATRLFPYGRGLVALFAGPPGTGKTMAAQVIAADLGLDLLAVDLSAVISKWVGETAQHLQQLLSSRAAQRAVLFFDEADALYAKRVEEVRDAQDRFANLDTSHLMTALEGYPGIVLLASNLKANIDGAFLRRIRHLVDFPKPTPAARLRIWRQAIQALFGAAELRRLGAQLERLARIEATGALIKNAALSALFAARQAREAPSVRLFGERLARELAKEGAALSARDLDALLTEGAT